MPEPDAGEQARPAAELIANHLLHLLRGAGLLNVYGHHSHDALDCFVAVCLVSEAAAKWEKHNLKASEAAIMADRGLVSRLVHDPSGDTMSWGEHTSPGIRAYGWSWRIEMERSERL
jgi:hypothetical protein